MHDEAPDNRAEIGKARRRSRAWNTWFYFWLAWLLLVPGLGIVGAVATSGSPPHPLFPLFIILAIAGGVAGVIGLPIAGHYSFLAKRRVRLGEEYDLMGFELIDQPEIGKLGFLHPFQAFYGSTSPKASSLGRGRYKDEEVLILDYSSVWPQGDATVRVMQTVILLTDACRNVPGMILQPLGFWESSPLPVPGEDAFNKKYSLASSFYADAPRFISSELADFLVDDGKMTLEIRNGDLCLMWKGIRLRPELLLEKVRKACEIARLLRERRDDLEGR